MKNGGRIIGGILFLAAAGAVFFLRSKEESLPEEVVCRPVKFLVVKNASVLLDRSFPGVVDAKKGVDLSYQVSGRIIEHLPGLSKGMRVKQGQLLGRLDPRDFESQLKNAEAEVDRSKSTLERISKALATGAVSKEDFSRAKAEYDKAVALRDIQKKALDDTKLYASFDGVIADSYPDVFSSITAGSPVVTLQDISSIQINVPIPEKYVIMRDSRKDSGLTFTVTFDSLPGQSFPAEAVSFTAKANDKLQTYQASFQMVSPPGLTILPGMTATVGFQRKAETSGKVAVPSDVVGVKTDGAHFVWLLKPLAGEQFQVTRKDVTVGERVDELLVITSGLSEGDRIAAAGIALLTEGQAVVLLKDQKP
jgi:RND family efflux transporter MFP subunit